MDSNGRNESQSEPTNLGGLWTRAVKEYLEKTGKSMEHMKAQSISDVLKATETDIQNFRGFRHDDGKVDKVSQLSYRLWARRCASNLSILSERHGCGDLGWRLIDEAIEQISMLL